MRPLQIKLIKPEKDSLMKVLKEFACEFVNLFFFISQVLLSVQGPKKQERKKDSWPFKNDGLQASFLKDHLLFAKVPQKQWQKC